MIVMIVVSVIMLLIGLFHLLLKQSKKLTGFIGTLMMRLWNTFYLPLVKWTMSKLNLNNNLTILDIGVGNGASSAYLLQELNPLAITGIDISKDAILQAKQNYSNKNIHFQPMDIHTLTFAAETFDLITAFQTHFHWDDLGQALQEIHRVLKPNGLIVFAYETTKIHYFLPEFKEAFDFQMYLSTRGFLLTSQHTTSRWSMYAFKKIK